MNGHVCLCDTSLILDSHACICLVAGPPSALGLQQGAAKLAEKVGMELPVINISAFLERFVKDLGLPQVWHFANSSPENVLIQNIVMFA